VELGEVAMGAVIRHPSDWNLAREALLSSGLAPTTPGITAARACGTSLDNAIIIANKIAAGQIEAGIAGGSDTTSDVPIVYGTRLRKRACWRSTAPSHRGKTAGGTARVFLQRTEARVSRRGRTAHRQVDGRALRADGEGVADQPRGAGSAGAGQSPQAGRRLRGEFFDDLLVPFRGLKRDGFLRPDASLDKLAALKPAFDKSSGHGTLTAGNSTGLSDGAAAVLLASDAWAAQRGLRIQAYLRDAEVAAVDFVHGEGLLMAPTVAVPRLLARCGLRLQDFDYYEIHEAFAAQVLCTLRAWESADYCKSRLGLDAPLGAIDPAKLNVHGSSLAVGHPFAATGARVLATLARLLEQRGSGRGLISICTAGGMGVTAILERP